MARPGSFEERQQRTYSRAPRTVAALATAFARGLRAGHVAATLKHFAGLGSVAGNEDERVQRIRFSRATLRRVDERPFRAGIAARVPLVMTSSAIYPALGARRPADLSHAVVTGELRHRLGFRGVKVTDAIDTPSLAPYGSVAQLTVDAALAGNDLLLIGGSEATGAGAHQALVRAAHAGRLHRTGLANAARRVLALRASLRRP